MKTTKLSNGYRIYLTNEEFRTLNYLTSIGYGDTQMQLKAGSRSIPKVVMDNLDGFKAPPITVDRTVPKDKGLFTRFKETLKGFVSAHPKFERPVSFFLAGYSVHVRRTVFLFFVGYALGNIAGTILF